MSLARRRRVRAADPPRVRRMALGAILMILVQAGLGMVVNLFVTIPTRHPGTHPANYFVGSFHSVIWAISSGPTRLAIHAAFGLALVVMVVSVAVGAIRIGRRLAAFWAVLGALLVIGAGFNGASFLDFNYNISSLIMALLAFGAVTCYSAVLFLAPR